MLQSSLFAFFWLKVSLVVAATDADPRVDILAVAEASGCAMGHSSRPNGYDQWVTPCGRDMKKRISGAGLPRTAICWGRFGASVWSILKYMYIYIYILVF